MAKQAVVFRPTCRRNVKEFTAKQSQQAAMQAGVTKPEEIAVRFNAKANTVTAVTNDPTAAEALTKVAKILTPEGPMEFQAIKAQDANQCKGIAYFKLDPYETD
ncbi:unnamed protein product, partial [Ixodes hexagonus]